MNELTRYHDKLVFLPDWNDASVNVTAKMKSLVQRYVLSLLKLRKESLERSGSEKDKTGTIAQHDWIVVWSSFLLLSYSKIFCQTFGREKVMIERLLDDAYHRARDEGGTCTSCGKDLEDVKIFEECIMMPTGKSSKKPFRSKRFFCQCKILLPSMWRAKALPEKPASV